MATHSSSLAWEIPWTEEPRGLQSMGSQRVRQLSNYTTTTRGKHSGKFPKAPRELDSQGPGYWDPSPPTSLSSCSTLASAHMGHGHPCGAPLLPTHQEASFTGPALGCARGLSVLTTDPLQLRLTQPPSRLEDS